MLSGDAAAIREALAIAEHLGRDARVNSKESGCLARVVRLLALVEGGDVSRVNPLLDGSRLVNLGTLWLWCREAIDAGRADVAFLAVRTQRVVTPFAIAVRAAIQAAAAQDELAWRQALEIAAAHDLVLLTVDALEGLAVAAGAVGNSAECLRLLGAAENQRDETGYCWRFVGERTLLEAARAAAITTLGDRAERAYAEGRTLTRADAVAYAARARGQRRRPRHGWASLTPTEHRVAGLVAEGLTNPQIAERLLMGRSTVKAHLEHIFPKLDVHTRAELSAEATRRSMQ
jgi:DNA-binding CsgD family transcriptional regulator